MFALPGFGSRLFTLSVSYNLNKTEIKYISKREI
jgi:hypothetical protein